MADILPNRVAADINPQPGGPPADQPKLDPRYAVVRLLGTGGMASVWRARDERLGREVALKVLHRNLPFSSSMRERLEREAKVAASLTHENVVQVYDYSVHPEGDSYIAMELVDGRTLRDVLNERKSFPWVVVALVSYELCRGLAYAHERGVIHRDVKPDNVMVSRTGSLKLGDFGIARAREHVQLTAMGAPVGTPAYLSPEQVRGEPADTRSDIFALGITLYELLCGRLPFDAETSTGLMYRIVEGKFTPVQRLGLEIDPDLAEIVDQCLSGDPAARPTAPQIFEKVGRLLHRRSVVDPRQALAQFFVSNVIPLTEVLPRVQAAPRTPTSRLVGIGAGIAVLAALGTWGALRLSTPPAPEPPPPLPPPAEVAAKPEPSPPPAPEPLPARPVASPEPQLPSPPPAASTPHRAPKPGGRTRAAASTAPAGGKGTLHLTVRGGWADVRLDGVVIGRTPTTRSFSVPAGSHVLELVNPHRAPYKAVVQIPSGGTLEREVELREAP